MPKRPPAYTRHKGSGQAVVRIDGHDCYLGRFGSVASRAEYDRLIASWLANGRCLPPAAGGSELSMNELMVAYLRHADTYYLKNGEPTSEPDNIRQALRFIRKLYGAEPARSFGPLAYKVVRQSLIDHGCCRTFINRQMDRVRRMFSWAASMELLPVENHTALLTVAGLQRDRTEARERPPVGPVPDDAIEKVLPLVPDVIAAMIKVQRLSGMRPQEITLMRADEIDQGDPACWSYHPGRHKTQHHGKARVVFLGPRAVAILKPYLDDAQGGHLFSPRRSEEVRQAALKAGRRSAMTPSHRARQAKAETRSRQHLGELYSVASYRRAIRRGCLVAGIPIWSPHRLRHTAGSEVRRRFGLEHAQAVLGHSEMSTTEIYAEADRDKARAAMSQIG